MLDGKIGRQNVEFSRPDINNNNNKYNNKTRLSPMDGLIMLSAVFADWVTLTCLDISCHIRRFVQSSSLAVSLNPELILMQYEY